MGLYIPEDDILHSHRCGNLKSFKPLVRGLHEEADWPESEADNALTQYRGNTVWISYPSPL
jgi:hypothetical protein